MKQTRQMMPIYYPAVHSIIDGAALGQMILQDFGLLAASNIYLIQSGLNDHYALHSQQGEFIIRVYRHGWRSMQDVTWELEFIDHLAKCGAPIAACVKRIDGHLFSTIPAIEGNRQVAVFQRAPGLYTHFGNISRYRISPAECAEQFGRSMAEVHVAADTFSSSTPRFRLDLDHLIDQSLQAIVRAYGHRGSGIDQLQYLANQLRHILKDDKLSQLDWGPCHGDMTGGNSTYWNDQVIHFDFDCAGPGWRAYDLGVFFWSMSVNGHGIDVWDRFISGYSARRSLSYTNLALVQVFASIRVIWLMGLWCANATVLGYHRLHEDYFDRELNRLNEFYNQAVRI